MITINNFLLKQTNFISKNSNINDSYTIAKINYGLQCLYLEGSKLLILFLIFYLFNSIDYFLILIFLLPIRSLLGGHHCKTYLTCLTFSLIIPIVSLIISNTLGVLNIFFQVVSLVILSYFVLKKKYVKNSFRSPRSEIYIKKQKIYALLLILIFFVFSNIFLLPKLVVFGYLIVILILFDFILRRN